MKAIFEEQKMMTRSKDSKVFNGARVDVMELITI